MEVKEKVKDFAKLYVGNLDGSCTETRLEERNQLQGVQACRLPDIL